MFLSKQYCPRIPVSALFIAMMFCTVITAGLADAATTKLAFCFVVNPNASNVEITFNPRKINTDEFDTADKDASYRLSRSNWKRWSMQRYEPKNVHDYGAQGAIRSYSVDSINKGNHTPSNKTHCIDYQVESSIDPKRLRD